MKNDATKVAVLMAVKDGANYLPEQIESILNQQKCDVDLLISDDYSTDGSAEILQKYAAKASNIKFLSCANPLGSSAKNFYHLISEADIGGFDYIAFADQDDIWLSDKLIRHIQLARTHNAEGVSSNVIAFWPDGRERLLDKAQPQRELDFLFESAGPGCTFLLSPWLIGKLREQLSDENSPAKEAVLHDWLAYSICRAYGCKWIIDNVPSLRYRQHETNVFGANVGFSAKWARLQRLREHWYRNEIIKVTTVCYRISGNSVMDNLVKLLENKSWPSQLKLLGYITKSRRKALDRFMLASAIILGLF
jgi:rhamnosyltransferase